MMGSVALDDAATNRGAATAVERLFRSEYRSPVRLASLLLDDRGASKEVVQDAFVKLQLGWERRRDPLRAPVIAALRTLPARQREALALKFYADLSEAETAAAMGVSTGSVKTHVHRGLAALEKLLEEER